MKFILKICVITCLIALTSSCTALQSQGAWGVYNDIRSYSKKFNEENIYLSSFGGLSSEGYDRLGLVYFMDQESFAQFSIEDTRIYTVNLYLDIINYLNTNMKFLAYNDGQPIPLDKFSLSLFFGDKLDPKYVFNEPMDINVIYLQTSGRLEYKKIKYPDHVHDESILEAVEILKKSDQIEHPEYLKWLDIDAKRSKDPVTTSTDSLKDSGTRNMHWIK